MSGNIVKNQHYVPQRYLRNFANMETKKSKDIFRFFIFDKVKNQVRANQNVENYASERYFYDVDFDELIDEAKEEGLSIDNEIIELTKEVDKQHLEHVFANNVETSMYNPFDKIIASYIMTPKIAYTNKNVIQAEEDRATIAYYLAIQFLRTKEFRGKTIQMYEQGTKLILKKIAGKKLQKDFDFEVKIKESMINLYHNQQLLDTELLEELTKSLLSHIWFFAVTNTGSKFYTSDNPLVLIGHEGQHGLKSRGVEIVFPITPRLALVIREVNYFEKNLSVFNKFVSVSNAYVEFCNSLQVFQSYRYIFSKDNDFTLASEILRENPGLSNVKRDRFLMG